MNERARPAPPALSSIATTNEPESEVAEYRPHGFMIAPEVIALRFGRSDTDYASDPATGRTDSVDSRYELGGRLGVGYLWSNGWDVVLRGTGETQRERDSDAQSTPAGLSTSSGAGFDTASAHLQIDFRTIDLEAGKRFGDWDGHRIRIFFGPRVAQTDSELETTTDPSAAVTGDRVFYTDDLDIHSWGVRAGAEGNIRFAPGWSIYLQGAASALRGQVRERVTRTSSDGAVVDFTGFGRNDDDMRVFEGAAGFQWQRKTFDHGMVAVRFGWELAEWDGVPTPTDVAGTSSGKPSDEDFRDDGPSVRVEWVF